MQIPLWAFLATVLLALTWQEMASVLLKRSIPTLTRSLPAGIRSSPSLFNRLAPHLPFLNSDSSSSSTASLIAQRPFSSSHDMSSPFFEFVKNRRTYYVLTKDSPISKDKIEAVVKEAVLHVPSSFNSQPIRVAILFGAEHDKFWEAVKAVLKPFVPDEKAWEASEARVNGFKAGAGSILFFESKKVTTTQQEQFPLYAEKFPVWTTQSDAMHQFAVWTALEAEGLGANLQHYNPLIDKYVQETYKIDPEWELNAQLVFGGRVEGKGPAEKVFQPVEERVKVFGK